MPIANDPFTDTDTTDLTAHLEPVANSVWLAHPTNGRVLRIQSNALQLYSGTGDGWFYVPGSPADANYYAQLAITLGALSGTGYAGVALRMDTAADTMYQAVYAFAASEWRLWKSIAGTPTLLDSAAGPASIGTYTLRLEGNGTGLSLLVGSTPTCSATDSGITAAGKPGLLLTADSSLVTVDDYYSDNLAAGPSDGLATITIPVTSDGAV